MKIVKAFAVLALMAVVAVPAFAQDNKALGITDEASGVTTPGHFSTGGDKPASVAKMTPEQRRALWYSLSPEERAAIIAKREAAHAKKDKWSKLTEDAKANAASVKGKGAVIPDTDN